MAKMLRVIFHAGMLALCYTAVSTAKKTEPAHDGLGVHLSVPMEIGGSNPIPPLHQPFHAGKKSDPNFAVNCLNCGVSGNTFDAEFDKTTELDKAIVNAPVKKHDRHAVEKRGTTRYIEENGEPIGILTMEYEYGGKTIQIELPEGDDIDFDIYETSTVFLGTSYSIEVPDDVTVEQLAPDRFRIYHKKPKDEPQSSSESWNGHESRDHGRRGPGRRARQSRGTRWAPS